MIHPFRVLATSTSSIVMFVATNNESEPSTSTSTSTTSSPSTTTTSSSVQWSKLCRRFKFSEILSATGNFDESLVIGKGGSAKVYKGNIKNGSILVPAAIKRLNNCMPNEGESEFWAEVQMLSKLRHCHLASLIGYCNHQREMILVYEYIAHGSLEDHLHKLATHFSWCQRLKICIGAARGLDYLHSGTGIEFGIIHRDVKSSNILLDESWAAKISDFGLFKISPRNQQPSYVSTFVKGTFGYIDPNYFATGKITRKSDVYAFGVVLLEVLCRKRAVDDSLEWGLATWAQDSIKEGHLKDIVDPRIRDEISRKCLKQYARIVVRCLDDHPKHRPTMAEVVHTLEYILTLQEKTNNLLQTTGKTIFGRMIDKFSIIDKAQNSGMEYIAKGEKANPLKILDGIRTVWHGQVELLSLVPKLPADEPKVEEKEAHKPEYPQVITVVLKLKLHCEGCTQKIKKQVLRMKGVESVKPDLKNSQITVKGTFKEPELVDYVQKRFRRNAVVVKQDLEPKKDDDKGEEDKNDGAVEKIEEKKAGDSGGVKGKDKEEEKQDANSDEEGRLYLPSGSDENGDDKKSANLRKAEYLHPRLQTHQLSQVTVKGTFAEPQLVDCAKKQTEKKVVVMKQDPEPTKEDKSREDKKDGAIEKKEEKNVEAAVGSKGKEREKDQKEKQNSDNNEDQNGGKGKEKENDKEVEKQYSDDNEDHIRLASDSDESDEDSYGSDEDQRLQFASDSYESQDDIKDVKLHMNEHNYYYYVNNPLSYQIYPPTYRGEPAYWYTPAPQIFSDDNPNSCSVM